MTAEIKPNQLADLILGISSDCVHFVTPSGAVGTDTHIFFRQIEALSVYFKSVIICCPFADFDPKLSYSIYKNKQISFIQSPHVGGDRILDKIELLSAIPKWLKLFHKLDEQTDIVYQRFPNNLNIPGFFYFYFKRKKVFASFTGSWDEDPGASWSTRFQRYLLIHFFRGPVWVYTTQRKIRGHIHSSFSPSYSQKEWESEAVHVSKRIQTLQSSRYMEKPLYLISVGTLCTRKNHSFILATCVMLRDAGIPFKLDIAGSGERMEEYRQFIAKNNLAMFVELKGSLHYDELRQLYRIADFVIQSPLSEPYGKVPIEGYFHGAIPILSSSSIMANYITDRGKRGFIFDLKDEDSLFNTLVYIFEQMPATEKQAMIEDGRLFVKNLTIDAWALDYFEKLSDYTR